MKLRFQTLTLLIFLSGIVGSYSSAQTTVAPSIQATVPSPSSALPSTATPTPPFIETIAPHASLTITSPTPTEAPMPNDLSSLEYTLAESGYQINPSKANKNLLIMTSEKVINQSCIAGISAKYTINQKQTGSFCDILTSKTLGLDPTNPAATCARMGIDSTDCSASYEKVDVDEFQPGQVDSNEKDLDMILESKKDTSEVSLIQKQISALSREYTTLKDPAKFDSLIELFRQQLGSFCTTTRYNVIDKVVIIPTPTPVSAVTQKPFQGMLDSLAKEVHDKNIPVDNSPTHIRLVNPACVDFLRQLKTIAPQHYLNICYRQGAFSPHCLKAKKLERQKTGKDNMPLGLDGISAF